MRTAPTLALIFLMSFLFETTALIRSAHTVNSKCCQFSPKTKITADKVKNMVKDSCYDHKIHITNVCNQSLCFNRHELWVEKLFAKFNEVIDRNGNVSAPFNVRKCQRKNKRSTY